MNSMARFLRCFHSFCVRKWNKLLLAFCWASGLIFGGLWFRYAGSVLVSQMPLAVISQPSIFGLLTCSVLPFLFSAFAFYINTPWLVYGICFLKAFSASYISCGVFVSFESAGWLVRWLFLFTDLFSSAVLYYCCHRHICGIRRLSAPHLAAYSCVLFLVAAVDYNYVMPLLRRILS